MKNSTILKFLAGIAIVAYLVFLVGIGNIISEFQKVNLLYVPAIVIIIIFSVVMRIINFRLFLLPDEKGRQISLAKLAWINLVSWAAGTFTPGKLGEFSSIYLLKEEGISTGKSAAISVLNKAITIAALFLLAIIGLIKYFGIGSSWKMITALVLILLLPYLLIMNRPAWNLAKRILRRFIQKYEKSFVGFANELQTYLTKRKMLIFYNFLVNLAWIAVSTLSLMLAFSSIGQDTSFVDVALINSIGTATSLVPITIGGLGLREASAIILFGTIGIGQSITLSAHLIITGIVYILAAATALLFLGKKRVNLSKP
jgi:glycosyltransferase 2 family protein